MSVPKILICDDNDVEKSLHRTLQLSSVKDQVCLTAACSTTSARNNLVYIVVLGSWTWRSVSAYMKDVEPRQFLKPTDSKTLKKVRFNHTNIRRPARRLNILCRYHTTCKLLLQIKIFSFADPVDLKQETTCHLYEIVSFYYI